MDISYSSANTFSECAYKYDLIYNQGVRAKQSETTPTSTGLAVHIGLQAALTLIWAASRIPNYTLMNHQINQYVMQAIQAWVNTVTANPLQVDDMIVEGDWTELVTKSTIITMSTLDDLFKRYGPFEVVTDADGLPLVEAWLEIPITDTGFVFKGKVDAVIHDKINDVSYVIDWKTRKSFKSYDDEQMNAQMGLYQFALKIIHDVHVLYGVLYQIKSETPQEPDRNKNGSMSRRAIPTTWEIYRNALLNAGLDPVEYVDEMKPKLDAVEWFRPIEIMRNIGVTSRLWSNLVMQARRIQATTEFPKAYNRSCTMCDFQALCFSDLHGYDTEYLFDTLFVRKDKNV